MLTQTQLAHEILSLVISIDEAGKASQTNIQIVEALTLVTKSVLSECKSKECVNQLTNLIDIIALRCK